MLIASGVLPRNLWPLGIVISVKVGRSGLVRSVQLRFISYDLANSRIGIA